MKKTLIVVGVIAAVVAVAMVRRGANNDAIANLRVELDDAGSRLYAAAACCCIDGRGVCVHADYVIAPKTACRGVVSETNSTVG